MEDVVAIVFIFGGGAAFLLAISPIGRAIADRIRGRGLGGGGADERIRYLQESHEALLEEMDGLRQEVGDLQERVDFTERLLARDREPGRLPGSSNVQD
jgi:hypothetical protein